jgi:Na+/citrate or Na+/malate symporter
VANEILSIIQEDEYMNKTEKAYLIDHLSSVAALGQNRLVRRDFIDGVKEFAKCLGIDTTLMSTLVGGASCALEKKIVKELMEYFMKKILVKYMIPGVGVTIAVGCALAYLGPELKDVVCDLLDK